MKHLVALVSLLFLPLATAHAQSGEFKVGVFGPLTGPAAADGNGCLWATQLAADQANARGGVQGRKVVVVSADDQAKPSEGITAVQKLVTRDGAVALVSCSYSGATRSAAGVAQSSKVPMVVSYAVHPEITKAGNYVWRMFSLGPVQGRAIAAMAREDGKGSKAAILWVKNDYGESISTAAAERFTKLGGAVVYSEPFAIGDKDFTTPLTKARAANPDVLLVVAYYNEGALIAQQARRQGITAPIYGSDGISAAQVRRAGARRRRGRRHVGGDRPRTRRCSRSSRRSSRPATATCRTACRATATTRCWSCWTPRGGASRAPRACCGGWGRSRSSPGSTAP